MEKEQSSILKPNNKLVGVKSSKTEEPKLPKPTGWRILVLPFKMKEKTKGGVILAEDTLERQQVASQVGLVMAMGPQCYKDKERYPEGPWCKEERLGYVCTLCRQPNQNRWWGDASAKRR